MHYPITRTTILAGIFACLASGFFPCLASEPVLTITWQDYIKQHGVPEVVGGRLFLSRKNEEGQIQLLEDIDFNDIKNKESVKEIDFSGHYLRSLPAEIGQFINLERLGLSHNSLQSLPPEIGYLENLERLDLFHNSLQSLPAEIGKLKNLECLIVASCGLWTLPMEIGQLKKLQHLCLQPYGRRLWLLPPTLSKLQEAGTEIFNLDNEKIQELQDRFLKLKNFIITAIENNNLKNVRAFCRLRAEPWQLHLNDFRDEQNNNLLHLAVKYHDETKDPEWKILKELIACDPGAGGKMLEEKNDRGEILLLQNGVGQAGLRKILELFTKLQEKKSQSEMSGEESARKTVENEGKMEEL